MKNYNYQKIKKEVEIIVKQANNGRNNIFTDTVWKHHIQPVVKYSLMLGKKLGADLEVLELAALLHDYAAMLNKKFCQDHHLHGARLAEKILKSFNYPEEKIEHIKDCIVSHRSSLKIKQKTIEAKILASADAMSHIGELIDMFYLAFGVHRFKTEAGAKWLKSKLLRDWQKIMPAGRKIIKQEYDLAVGLLDKAIK
jgi:uncharacterized protein